MRTLKEVDYTSPVNRGELQPGFTWSEQTREAQSCFGGKPRYGAKVVARGNKWLSDFPKRPHRVISVLATAFHRIIYNTDAALWPFCTCI